MVQSDLRDHAYKRFFYGIGRIQSAAESRLEDHIVGILLFEPQICRRRIYLKECRIAAM